MSCKPLIIGKVQTVRDSRQPYLLHRTFPEGIQYQLR